MGFRIDKIELQQYGVLESFSCDQFANINVLIGENGTGKTILLKALYSAIRSIEEHQRGDDVRPMSDVLSDKIRWTFQTDKLGELVNRSSNENLSLTLCSGEDELSYSFSKSAATKAGTVKYSGNGKGGNSVFIPAKEVLSLYSIILKSREVDQVFGFDDTYFDLAKALRISPARGKNYSAFAVSRKQVYSMIDGRVDYDEQGGKWSYKNRKNQRFPIGTVSEGVKKIAILDRLLANGYINKDSVIFIDEIESALHPSAIVDFLEIINYVANEMGIQFFIATHSYFVIKKLFLLAVHRRGNVTCISLGKGDAPKVYDLHDGMPDNSIVDTSIRLYEQEIEETL